MADVRELSYSECEALLRAGVMGRVGLSTPDGQEVLPVNYSVVDQGIVIRTAPQSVLGTHGRDADVAFEVDYFDYAYHRGWSVMARGRAEAVDDAGDVSHIRSVWEPRPWAGGERPLMLRIRWTTLTGRQVGTGWDPYRELPYRRVL